MKPIRRGKTIKTHIKVPIGIGDNKLMNLWHEPSKMDMMSNVNDAASDLRLAAGRGLKNELKCNRTISLKANNFRKIKLKPLIDQDESDAKELYKQLYERLKTDETFTFDPYMPIDRELLRDTSNIPDKKDLHEIHKSKYGKQILASKGWKQTKMEDYFPVLKR